MIFNLKLEPNSLELGHFMRRLFHIFCVFLILALVFSFTANAKMQTEEGTAGEAAEETDVPFDEGLFEDAGEPLPEEEAAEKEEEAERQPAAVAPRVTPPAAVPPAVPAVRPAGEAAEEELRDVIIDAAVNLNYVFDFSPDNFIIKYRVHLEGKVAAAAAVVRGNANIAVEVQGFLAKWPTGNCKLAVSIPDSPFEMTFRKAGTDQANINLKFPKAILETWESQCTFQDAPNAKFNTKGEPEKWLETALQKTSPPLGRINLALSNEETTSLKFMINKQTLKDPPLGSAEVDGNGTITIKPASAE
jgi:hypothetical protein